MDNIALDVLLATVTAYGAAVTKIVDALRNIIGRTEWFRGLCRAKGAAETGPKWLWNISAFVVGIGTALVFQANVLPSEGAFGMVTTGVLIGAASSGYHELFDALSGVAKASSARVEADRGARFVPPGSSQDARLSDGVAVPSGAGVQR